MDRLRWLLFQIRTAFLWRQKERDLDDELKFYLEMESVERIEVGMAGKEARFAAACSLGNVALVREETRMV